MTTNNKKFKEQVQTHILEILSRDESINTKIQLYNVVSDFNSWYCGYNRKLTPNHQEAFTEFLQCLPSSINVEFEHFEIYNTLRKWFEAIDKPYKESVNSKEAQLYYNLIYREFKTLCKEHRVEFSPQPE